MSHPEKIREIVRRMRFRISEQASKRTQQDMFAVYKGSRHSGSALAHKPTRRTIMLRRLKQVAIPLSVLIIGYFVFSHPNSGIAFADVLQHIQQRSYAFDLTVSVENTSNTAKGQVLQPGHMRFDYREGLGKVSRIVDRQSRRSLVLVHPFKTAKYVDIKAEYGNTGIDKLLSLCSLPVENLWNLQDHSEEDLGEKVISETSAQGYRVVQDDDYFDNEITLWADAKSGRPISVEIVSTALKPPYGQITWKLERFDLDIDLDESFFSLDVPSDYTLTDQTSIQDIEFHDQSSEDALKITRALQFCQDNKNTEAIESLMSVDWDKPIIFAQEPHVFTLTEKELVLLKNAEREELMPSIMGTCATIRKICFELVRISKEAQSARDYARAETYLMAGWRLGELIGPDQEDILIVRLAGIAMRKMSLVELKALYEQTNDQSKLINVQQKIQTVDAQHQALAEQLKQYK